MNEDKVSPPLALYVTTPSIYSPSKQKELNPGHLYILREQTGADGLSVLTQLISRPGTGFRFRESRGRPGYRVQNIVYTVLDMICATG